MNWFLTLSFAFLFVINYILSGKKILFPSVIVSAMFTLSSLFAALNSKWGIQIQAKTYMILLVAIMIFSIGCLIGNIKLIVFGSKWRHKESFLNVTKIIIPVDKAVVVAAICMIVSLVYFRHQLELSYAYGNTRGINGMIGTLRNAMVQDADVARLGILLNLGISFTKAAGIISLYIIIFSIIKKKKCKFITVLPLLCLIINIIISTGRGALIMVVTSAIYDVYALFYLKNDRKINHKIIKYGVILVVAFVFAFRVLGTLTGKSEALDFWDTLSIYIGSPIVCIDHVIQEGIGVTTQFGYNTFKGIYNMLSRFIGNMGLISNHDEKFRWASYSSNIYTALYPYLIDFGILGMIVIQFVLGVVNGAFWRKYTSSSTISDFILIIYGRFFGGALVYYSIAERFFSNYLALNAIAELVFYIVILRLFVKHESLRCISRE